MARTMLPSASRWERIHSLLRRIMARQMSLCGSKQVCIGQIYKKNDQQDDGHDCLAVERQPCLVDHEAQTIIGAEQFGDKRRLPGHAKGDAEGREEEWIEQRQHDKEKDPERL